MGLGEEIQGSSERRSFLFSFNSLQDKKKVLKGGAWSFDKVLVILEDGDGIIPMNIVPMRQVIEILGQN